MSSRIVQITDPHLLAPGETLMGLDVTGRLEDVLQLAEELDPDAYFFTGDFCAHEPVQEVYHRLRERLDRLPAPYYLTAGNHDDREMMRRAFDLPGRGQEGICGRVAVHDQSFLFLDSSPGFVDDQQLDWLTEALVEHPVSDIVIHHPPIALGVKFMDAKYPLRKTERLLRLITEDGVRRRVFCGHYHSVRTVSHGNLDVYLCPPTSFFIDPAADEFSMVERAPGCQLLEWTYGGDFRYTAYATSTVREELQK
ncbi:metallophosphoesterase [Lewinella sp. JB7]|uniref:metallophosphoesterase n=1 Tax=Lewinella sp. JB7 TaxID=2962887 RepID=UPI0020C9B0B2|nr:metallophosphoesterase [Lewinella sp. JB7]